MFRDFVLHNDMWFRDQSSGGFALLAVILMIVGSFAIISMVSVQRLILLVNMCDEEKAFFQAHYLAQSAKAMALYHLYDKEGIEEEDVHTGALIEMTGIGNYKYTITNCHTSDWTYRVDTIGYYLPVLGDLHAAQVALGLYVNDYDEDFKFTQVSEFVRYRK